MIKVAFAIGDYPPTERRRREDAARRYASADIEVGTVAVAARPFDGLTPAEIQAAAPLYHEAFRQAEREGYDAVAPLGMLDLGVDGGRSAVDIPVGGAAAGDAARGGAGRRAVRRHVLPHFGHRAASRADPRLWHGILHRRAPRERLLPAAHRREPRAYG
jgi:hypothetical protein